MTSLVADPKSCRAIVSEFPLSTQRLAGKRLLVLEDEFLIAMDVEQLCRDHGASDVIILRTLAEALDESSDYDAAVIDLLLGGESTLPFAATLSERGVPFIFASGYSDRSDVAAAFPGVVIVGKPYSGHDLIDALAAAILSGSNRG